MKKMSLNIAQSSLSREEMRMITGGSGGGGCSYNACGGREMITCCDGAHYHCSNATGVCVRR